MKNHHCFINQAAIIALANNKPILRISNKSIVRDKICCIPPSLCLEASTIFNTLNLCHIKECCAYLNYAKVFHFPHMSCVKVCIDIELIYCDCFGCIHKKTIRQSVDFFNIPIGFNLSKLKVCVSKPICSKISCNQVCVRVPVIIYG